MTTTKQKIVRVPCRFCDSQVNVEADGDRDVQHHPKECKSCQTKASKSNRFNNQGR